MSDYVTRYSVMPIPPIEEHTTYFEAGAIQVGVEYRVLDRAIAEAASLEAASGDAPAVAPDVDDRGVSLHVFGVQDGERREHLRFDCFVEDPHYHYVSWRGRSNDMVHIDPVADGEPLAWALERVRTRLPQMLLRAGAPELAGAVDLNAIERVLPELTACAYSARRAKETRGVRS